MKIKNLNYLTIIVLFAAALLVSCNKDEDKPAYVGNWISQETDGDTVLKTTLELKESSFTQVISMKIGNSTSWIEMYGIKADLSVSGNVMTYTLTSIGAAEFNMQTLSFGDIVWYNTGVTDFNNLLETLGMTATMKIQFAVSSNTLTVVPDVDNNGTFDASETQIFTKE